LNIAVAINPNSAKSFVIIYTRYSRVRTYWTIP